MAGPHVFEDGRVGLWIVNLPALRGRLAAIRAFAGGMVTDLFLPRDASANDLGNVRKAGFVGAHIWAAVDGLSAAEYAARTIADVERAKPGAVDLNVELGADAALEPFMHAVVLALRAKMPGRRLRLNVGAFKGAFLPVDLVLNDPQLYACEQTYYGDMSRVSEAEALLNLLEAGVPMQKAALCYGAAALVPDPDVPAGGSLRVVGLGTVWRWSDGILQRPLRRGVIFHDDLLADVGLL